MKPFFLVLARDKKFVDKKIKELKNLGVPYSIVCGEKLSHTNVIYRKPKGKYDAINFGYSLVPQYSHVVALNDADTRIENLETALRHFDSEEVALVFVKVRVKSGPQKSFYVFLDSMRKKLPIAASGELMLVRRDVLGKVLPIKPCKAEDSYILFKVLELKHKVVFCEECCVETERTKTFEEEKLYKRRTVAGLYQALSCTKPSIGIRLFYFALPWVSPLFLILGRRGYYWMTGILLGFLDYTRGDRSGSWKAVYGDQSG